MRSLGYERTGGPLNGTLAYLLEAGTWSPNSYLALNRAVTEYLAGKPDRLDHIAREGRPGDGDFHYFSTGMGTAVECNDYPVAWDRTADFAQRTAQLDQAIAAFSRRRLFAPLTVSQGMTLPATGLTGCLAWPPPTAVMEPPVPARLTQPAGLPVLVLSGEFDYITTVREARQGGPPLPLIATPDRPRPRARLGPLLPVPLASGSLDPALRRPTLGATPARRRGSPPRVAGPARSTT